MSSKGYSLCDSTLKYHILIKTPKSVTNINRENEATLFLVQAWIRHAFIDPQRVTNICELSNIKNHDKLRSLDPLT